jgi:hypothetical protein
MKCIARETLESQHNSNLCLVKLWFLLLKGGFPCDWKHRHFAGEESPAESIAELELTAQ